MTPTSPEHDPGNLLLAGFEGTEPSAEIRELIRGHHLGGVILYAKNCRDAGQVLELTNSLQDEAKTAGADQPLLIAIDQEQGRVVRITEGVTLFPPMGEIARIGSPSLIEGVARAVSRELLAVGVNWNLAPVADVLSAPSCPVGTRSFGTDPAAVSGFVRAWVEGARSAGMISCAKHFPGHGGTDADSHFTSPRIGRSRKELEAVDLPPFRAAVDSGVPAVMTTHITFPAIDAELPATFSPKIIDGLLRRELGFDGVVVSDDLEMAGSAESFSLFEGALQALEAGADIFIVSGMLLPERDLEALLQDLGRILAEGVLEEGRFREASRRMRSMKARYLDGAWRKEQEEAQGIIRCREHLDLLEHIETRLSEERNDA
jgi:beta-N-acetylhexosaminidase